MNDWASERNMDREQDPRDKTDDERLGPGRWVARILFFVSCVLSAFWFCDVISNPQDVDTVWLAGPFLLFGASLYTLVTFNTIKRWDDLPQSTKALAAISVIVVVVGILVMCYWCNLFFSLGGYD